MSGPPRCCPDEDRIEGLKTVLGVPAVDVHRHKGLLRGFVATDGGNRLLHWYRNGRLSPAVETDHDLRRTR